MDPAEVMTETRDSYLKLNFPYLENLDCQQAVADILRIEPLADAGTVEGLLTFPDWRGRLVGHVLAVRKGARQFVPAMLDSLADPRGLAIVPTCAALLLGLADEMPDRWMTRLAAIDRSPFDGEVGWSLDKLTFRLGWSPTDPGEYSPNEGKDFDLHLALFRSVA